MDSYANMEHILCRTMMDSEAMRELNLELLVPGSWASCALMRIIGVGLVDRLHTLRLRMRCNEHTIHAAQQIAVTFMHHRWTMLNRLSTLELDLTDTDLDVSTGRFLVRALYHLPALRRLSLDVSRNPLIGNSTLFHGHSEWERTQLPYATNVDHPAPLQYFTLCARHCGMGIDGFRRWMHALTDERFFLFTGLQMLSLEFAGNRIGHGFNHKMLPLAFCPAITRRLCIDVTDNQFTDGGHTDLTQWLECVRKRNPTIEFVMWQ